MRRDRRGQCRQAAAIDDTGEARHQPLAARERELALAAARNRDRSVRKARQNLGQQLQLALQVWTRLARARLERQSDRQRCALVRGFGGQATLAQTLDQVARLSRPNWTGSQARRA
jgi:hypothetical protein